MTTRLHSSSPTTELSIRGLSKLRLLHVLWVGSDTSSLFAFPTWNTEWNQETWQKAQLAIKDGYIGVFHGRTIQCDLSGETVCPAKYDDIVGRGAMARIIQRMRYDRMVMTSSPPP
jgi:hypothetical protein